MVGYQTKIEHNKNIITLVFVKWHLPDWEGTCLYCNHGRLRGCVDQSVLQPNTCMLYVAQNLYSTWFIFDPASTIILGNSLAYRCQVPVGLFWYAPYRFLLPYFLFHSKYWSPYHTSKVLYIWAKVVQAIWIFLESLCQQKLLILWISYTLFHAQKQKAWNFYKNMCSS